MAFISYKVKQGDSLSAIADDYGVSVSTIQNYNSISDAEYIQVGDILKIPGNSEISTNYTIQYGDSLATIAYKFGTTVSELQSLNNISNPDYIYEGQTIQVSGSSSAISQSNYTIQYGDSLESIASKFNTTVSELQSLNNISNPDYIQIGQTIIVSGTESNSNQSTYTVQYGDSLELIANKFNTTISELQSLNNISNPDFIQVGQTIYLSGTKEQSNQSTYTIQYGDTLESIAYRFGTTINDLQSLNGITNPDFIQVGQVINIKGEPITSSSKVSKYTVQSGDNLSLVAQKINTTVSELQSLNHLANPDFLQMGQKLLVPGSYNENEKNIEENDNSNNNSEDSSIPQSNDKYLVSKQQLVAIGWPEYVVTESMLNDLNSCLKTFEITTKSRVMHFISQCSHESVAGTYREEIASGVDYEWRADLGNTQPGDGTKFKGGGYIQLTGRSNYTQFANSIGDSNITSQGVSYVAEKYPWTSAGFWWYSHGMNLLCDSNPTVEQVTLRVNGGYNGLADRKQYYQRCLDVFSNFGQKTHANSGSASWLNQYGVTAEYGYYAVNVNNNMHYGMDFGLFTGTPVKAITNGTVLETNWNPGGGGNTITIKEDDNHYQWYMHLSEFNVTPGQNVNTGDVIAYSGATGGVTGPHLHFQRMIGEVSNSAAENPREFLENLGLNKK